MLPRRKSAVRIRDCDREYPGLASSWHKTCRTLGMRPNLVLERLMEAYFRNPEYGIKTPYHKRAEIRVYRVRADIYDSFRELVAPTMLGLRRTFVELIHDFVELAKKISYDREAESIVRLLGGRGSARFKKS